MVNPHRLRAESAEMRPKKGFPPGTPSLSGRDRVGMDAAAERRDHRRRRWSVLGRLGGIDGERRPSRWLRAAVMKATPRAKIRMVVAGDMGSSAGSAEA